LGFFSKSVPDIEWQNQAVLLFQTVLPIVTTLDKAIAKGSTEKECKALYDAAAKLPGTAESIKQLPNPTSSNARQANKNLKSAMKCYIDGIKQGTIYFKDIYGGPGERFNAGGATRRATALKLTFVKTIYEELMKTAQKYMAEAVIYFSNQEQ
jgi:hypothetical protein